MIGFSATFRCFFNVICISVGVVRSSDAWGRSLMLAPIVESDNLCDVGSRCNLELVQTASIARAKAKSRAETSSIDRKGDLVFMHIPFNFGHTVEFVALLREPMLNVIDLKRGWASEDFSGGEMPKFGPPPGKAGWLWALMQKRPGGQVWGHMNPDLQAVSEITGCPMYYTPPKYWPSALAQRYFGNKTVFGLLRDPYERLVALFRGNYAGYGGGSREAHVSCDINAGIKQMLQRYEKGDVFAEDCTYLPQAEYFEGQHGVKLPIDNRQFPDSMNRAFKEHGHNFHIRTKDIQHVDGCNDVWSADLDNETKALVRKVYARDFDLLCSEFQYCDVEESVCLQKVPSMCPDKAFLWDDEVNQYKPK